MLYGAEAFAAPEITTTNIHGHQQRNPKSTVIKRLTKIQRQAAIIITGAMRTTAGDILNIHANLLPPKQRIEKMYIKLAYRLTTLPPTHPLYHDVTRASRFHIKHHRGPINDIIQYHKVQYKTTDTILPVRQSPKWTFKGKCIIETKTEKAIQNEIDDKAKIKIFTDRSGIDGQVGAAAVMFEEGREVEVKRFRLGPLRQHEVYDGEGIGMVTAAGMLTNKRGHQISGPTSIYIDSQPAIRAAFIRKTGPSHHIWDGLHRELSKAQKQHPNMEITIHWIPGHKGVAGNERADVEAKRAAKGDINIREMRRLPSILKHNTPYNPTSLVKTAWARAKRIMEQQWKQTKRQKEMAKKVADTRPQHYQKLTKDLPRVHTSILIQLRTGHIPLQAHLYRIQRADTPTCPTCHNHPETVEHYLLHCPTYDEQRKVVRHKLGPGATSIKRLLATRRYLPALMVYIRDTARFQQTFPRIPPVELSNKDDDEDEIIR